MAFLSAASAADALSIAEHDFKPQWLPPELAEPLMRRYLGWRLSLARVFPAVRDRLRCPECSAVGTWKPHGYDPDENRQVRRWLCKWCGFYVGEDGVKQSIGISRETWVWDLDCRETPRSAAESVFGRPVNPWRG